MTERMMMVWFSSSSTVIMIDNIVGDDSNFLASALPKQYKQH